MPKQRYLILPPHLDALAALAFDSWEQSAVQAMLASQPGIVGGMVDIHDDGTATLSATDGECGALWTTPLPPAIDASQPGHAFPDLAKLIPTVPPIGRVRFDVERLGRIVAAAAKLCSGTVEMTFYPAGSCPLRPDGPAPVILKGGGVQGGGVFIGFLQPIPPAKESTT
jgi:hypothetical protein